MAITKVTSSVLSSGSATDGYVLTADGSGNSAWEAAAGGGVDGIVSSADATAITIDSSENVGIGKTPNRSRKLEVAGTMNLDDGSEYEWGDGSVSIAGNSSTELMTFAIAGAEKMRFDNNTQSGGSLRIGTTGILGGTPEKVSIQGPIGMTIKTTSYAEWMPLILWNNASTANNSSTLIYVTFSSLGNGNVGSITSVGTTTSYNTSSDYRLKENVDYTWDATTRLKQLKPARFNWISNADRTVDGFLAHEVQDIVPEAITGQKDAMKEEEYEVTPEVLDEDGNVITEAVWGTRTVPDYQSIDQSKLVPLLTKALQEQQTMIEDLQARIETLENA